MRTFVIDPDTWFRGRGDRFSRLLIGADLLRQAQKCAIAEGFTEDAYLTSEDVGSQCCVGQIGEQCGVTREQLEDASFPRCLHGESRELWPVNASDPLWKDMAGINDARDTTDAQKIARLNSLTKPHGFRLVLKGGAE